MLDLRKNEIKYIVYTGLFAVVLFMFVLPKIIPAINGTSPFLLFLFFNLGIIFLLNVFLKIVSTNKGININGSIGLLCLILAIDSWNPPYLVSVEGALSSNVLLAPASTDYMWGYIATSIGLGGVLVWIFAYILVPIILLFIAARMLPDFTKHI